SIAEQDPEKIFEAVLDSIAEVMHLSNIDSKDVSFISFSSAMHSVIAVGEDNEPITACITWLDNRSHAWTERLQYDIQEHNNYLKIGPRIIYVSTKIMIILIYNYSANIDKIKKKYIDIREYVF